MAPGASWWDKGAALSCLRGEGSHQVSVPRPWVAALLGTLGILEAGLSLLVEPVYSPIALTHMVTVTGAV